MSLSPVLGYLGSKLYLDIGPVTGSLKLVNPEPGIPGPGGWYHSRFFQLESAAFDMAIVGTQQ